MNNHNSFVCSPWMFVCWIRTLAVCVMNVQSLCKQSCLPKCNFLFATQLIPVCLISSTFKGWIWVDAVFCVWVKGLNDMMCLSVCACGEISHKERFVCSTFVVDLRRWCLAHLQKVCGAMVLWKVAILRFLCLFCHNFKNIIVVGWQVGPQHDCVIWYTGVTCLSSWSSCVWHCLEIQ